MTNTALEAPTTPDVDPDPFGIGIAIFAAMVSGASFLETRRQTAVLQQQQRAAFRSAWFDARRSVIFFKRAVDEFETFVLEDGYARRSFRVGAVRLVVDARRGQQLRRLRGQALTTANTIGNDLDRLSDFLGPPDQEAVTAILTGLHDLDRFPEQYADLVTQGRAVIALYTALLEGIADREAFDADTPAYTTSTPPTP
ncbi:MAG TPA: hypothetical protein VFQ85_09115 [Mycobacteriales bacterium]|jgi:hypothetical protein|nr:hypothetical protein [Mycobacteriales bacterium]